MTRANGLKGARVQVLTRGSDGAMFTTWLPAIVLCLLAYGWRVSCLRCVVADHLSTWVVVEFEITRALLLLSPVLLYLSQTDLRPCRILRIPATSPEDPAQLAVHLRAPRYRGAGYRARLVLQVTESQPRLWLFQRGEVLQEFELGSGLDLDSLPDNGEPLWQGSMPVLQPRSHSHLRVLVQLARLKDGSVREQVFPLCTQSSIG